MTQDQARFRLECEARAWLRAGYTNKSMLDELRKMLGKHRRENAIEQVIEEMRRQWARKDEWMTREAANQSAEQTRERFQIN